MGRKTGLMLANVYQGASRAMWRYAAVLAKEHPDDSLIIFPGGRLGFLGSSEYLRNSIYDLVDSSSIDGALIWSSSLTGAEGLDNVISFVKGIADHLPVVSMCMTIPGISSVDFDAYTGTYSAVKHFIDEHGAEKIAFIRGPVSHRSAEARYRAYLDALKDSGLEADERLITSPRPWGEGAMAARELLEERKLKVGKDFSAVVAASDLLILGAEPVFRKAGISIPEDIGISGFNDNEENQLLDVELTTIRMPIKEILAASYSLLGELEEGNGDENLSVLLPATFIIRRSCGCSDSLGGIEKAGEKIKDIASLKTFIRECTGDEEASSALFDILSFLYSSENDDGKEISRAVSRYFDSGADANVILEAVTWCEKILGETEEAEGKRDYLLSRIVHESRKLYAREQQRLGEVSRILDSFKTELLATRSYSTLPLIMHTVFPSLGITGALLMLYEDFQYTRMLGGFSGDKLFSESVRFPRRMLVPEMLSSFTDKGTFIVEPLFYDKQELGYILVAARWCEGYILEDIRASLSSAIKGISLTEVAQKAAEAAEEGERKAGEFYASVSEALRGPLSAMHRMLANSGAIPRSRMSEEVRRAEHMLSLSLAEFGELDMEKALVPLSGFVSMLKKNLNASVACPDDLPSIEMDAELIMQLVSLISDTNPSVTIELRPSSVLLSVKGGPSSEQAMQLAAKIAVLHSGELKIDGEFSILSLPYPTLSGHPAASSGNGPVVWLSGGEEIPEAISDLKVVCMDEDDAPELYKMDPRPSAIAWRKSSGTKSGAAVLRLLRSHRFSRTIPFIAFGIEDRAVSLSVALECDRADTEDSVILLMPHLPQLERILSDFGRVEDGLSESEILAGKGGKPRLVVLSCCDTGLLSALRHSKRFSSVLVLVVKDIFTEKEIEAIADSPNVLIANSSILDSPDFIARLVSVLGGGELLPPLTGALVKRAIAFLNRHLSHQISRWQLAESVNISEDYLTRIFRREMGISPWDYLTRCRVGAASELLLSSGAPLSEIAIASGFQDQAYFCRVFRRVKGCSPSQYRQRN